MRNKEIAGVLYEIADLLDIKGEKFKPNAYRRVARSLEGLSEDIESLHKKNRLGEVPGIGEAIQEKIKEYLTSGSISLLEKLKSEIPQSVVEMLDIPSVGPKTVGLVWIQLGITSVEELRKAVEDHRLQKLKGFGAKKEEKIIKGIQFMVESKKRTLLGVALPIAEEMMRFLLTQSPCEKVSYAGSIRRMKETVGDLDILAVSKGHEKVVRTFTTMPLIKEVVMAGDTKATVILQSGIQADLRVLDEQSWGAGLQYFTGSVDHNIHLRTIAQKRGLKLNEYGVFKGEEQMAGENEESVYKALGLEFIEPEMREDNGEIEAAQSGRLPNLLTLQDIHGDLHVHTNMSDGADTLEAIVTAAQAKDYEYVGISDHSQSLLVARGMSADDLLMRRDEIRKLDRKSDIRVLVGTECEILENGNLDYPDDVLKELDFVIAAVHSKFKMTADKMTDRILTAMSNPYVHILAHPFTGLINRREPIQFDYERVVIEAADKGCALEINAYPDRLDLSGSAARLAKENGAKLIINTDSHSVSDLDFMRYGVGTARRGWLEPNDVVNCWPYEQMKGFFSR